MYLENFTEMSLNFRESLENPNILKVTKILTRDSRLVIHEDKNCKFDIFSKKILKISKFLNVPNFQKNMKQHNSAQLQKS